MPAQLDIDVPLWRGDTVFIPFELTTAGTPINLQGVTIVFSLKLDPTVSDEQAEFLYTKAVPADDADGLAGRHVVRIERDQLLHLELAPHTYQFKVIYPGEPDDTEITYVWGKILVRDS